MNRRLRVRILFVLIALAAIPAAALPFAERLRAEWAKFWEPKPQEFDWTTFASDEQVLDPRIFLCPSDGAVYDVVEIRPLSPTLPADGDTTQDDGQP